MGARRGRWDQRPVHTVTLKTFQLSKTEVTVAQYRRCVLAGHCTQPRKSRWCNWGVKGRDNHPVNCLLFTQAAAYAKWAEETDDEDVRALCTALVGVEEFHRQVLENTLQYFEQTADWFMQEEQWNFEGA